MKRASRVAVMSVVVAAWVVCAGAAGRAAQAPSTPGASAPAGQAAQGASDQFVPVKALPAQPEEWPASRLVLGAYGFIWAVLIVYVWSVWRRLGKVEEEIRTLSARLAEKAPRA